LLLRSVGELIDELDEDGEKRFDLRPEEQEFI
jgi:hypothetical protein